MAEPTPFDTHAAAFRDYQQTPWSRLRYVVAAANLRRHLDGRPLRVLDAGGGNGLEALVLAEEDHVVSLLDPSGEMLAQARQTAESLGVLAKVTFHQGDLAAIPTLFTEGAFELVLCHNVLQYVVDLTASLAALRHALRSGGLISVICLNRYSEAFRLAVRELDPHAACDVLDATTARSVVFGTEVKAYTAADIRNALEAAGFSLLGRYGIRCVCDYIANDEVKHDPSFFAGLERLEVALSGRYPYYLLARSFQLIAMRSEASSGAFAWFAEEPELYSDNDLQERFEWPATPGAEAASD